MREELVKKLLFERTGNEPLSVHPLIGGEVGHVYLVETAAHSFVVKLVEIAREKEFSDAVNERVYGAQFNNLLPAYELIKAHGILIPALHASGTLVEEGMHFEIMDYLDGHVDDYTPGWSRALGTSLSKMHAITRPYQGLVHMDKPYTENWKDAFIKSFQSQLGQVAQIIDEKLYSAIETYLDATAEILTEPREFVLSHVDGFQGIFRKQDGEWRLLGVIDIEDHQFTDQRFVLAGIELAYAFRDKAVPQEFWNNYTKPVDATFSQFKKLFQLYYLLVWTRVMKDRPESFKKCIDQLVRLIESPA